MRRATTIELPLSNGSDYGSTYGSVIWLRPDGEFTTTMPSHGPWNGDPCRLPYIGQNNYFLQQLPKLMPAVEDVQSTNDGRPKDLVAIAVATLVSADSTRIDWRYFVL